MSGELSEQLTKIPNEQREKNNSRFRYFYGKPSYDANHDSLPELKEWRDTVFDSFEEHMEFDPIVLSNGTNISNIDELRDYANHIFVDTSDSRSEHTAEQFWQQFTSDYIRTLDNFSSQIPPLETDIDAVVLITARNEDHIERTIETITKKNPTAKIQIIIVNNFHEKESNSTMQSNIQNHMNHLKKTYSAVVVNAEVPEYSNAGFAKKVGTETVIRRMWKDKKYYPILSVDADVEGFSENDFVKTYVDTINTGNHLVATSDYDYSEESQEHFPAWGYRCQLMKSAREIVMTTGKRTKYTPLLGANFMIHPNTYMLVGGYDPVFAEDKTLAKKLRSATNYKFEAYDPVQSIGTVYVNPSKELDNLSKNCLPEQEWLNANAHDQSHSNLRFDWKKTAPRSNAIFLPTLTVQGEIKALESVQQYLEEVYTSKGDHYPKKAMSSILLQAISKGDYLPSGVVIRLSNGSTLNSKPQVIHFLQTYQNSDSTYFDYHPNMPEIVSFKSNLVTKVVNFILRK